mgnify:CR=1 FL=1
MKRKTYVIKKLKWDKWERGTIARTPQCNYSVSFEKSNGKYYSFAPGQYGQHRTLKAARRACEEHYEQAALTYLEPAE